MFCHLTRRMISRAADGGGKMPRFASRHERRCRACRDYARFVESLPSRFTREMPAFLADVPEFSPNPVPPPVESVRRRLLLRPLPVAAVLVVIVSAMVLFRVILREPALTIADKNAAIAGLISFAAIPNELQGAVAQAESPLVRERLILENSILSAIDFFQTGLNIRIERKQAPKTI